MANLGMISVRITWRWVVVGLAARCLRVLPKRVYARLYARYGERVAKWWMVRESDWKVS